MNKDKKEEIIDYKNLNVRLTIRLITLWENLTGKPYSKFTTDIENVMALIYCILIDNGLDMTFEECAKTIFMNEKLLQSISDKIEKEIKIQEQFIRKKEEDNPPNQSVSNNNEEVQEEEGLFVGNMIPALVDCGLSPEFIYDRLPYWEIDNYISYRDKKKQVELEEKRLFTYLQMLPHIDSRKVKMEDILPFEWEKEEKKKAGLKEIEKHKHLLDKFLQTEAIDLSKENNENNIE